MIGRDTNEMKLLHALGAGTAPRTATSAADGSSASAAARRPCAPNGEANAKPASPSAAAVAQCGGKAALREQPERTNLSHLDDHGTAGLSLAQEGHDAVGAGRRALHDALVTADEQRGISHASDPTQGV